MKIIAIWNRDKVAPECGSIFILTEDGQFGEFELEKKYIGLNENNERVYMNTGNFEFWREDLLMGNKWDFRQANYFIKHFGGQLEWRQS